ncbi:hypothetical protein [Roseimarinus sediminis]|uniref:hypothetical protein n=1 Tax=Roseimarinus sediminis TaxID=1610899 RepID=UPI003D222958
MEKEQKIKHPFQVPENFHRDFKMEMIEEIQHKQQKSLMNSKLKKISLNVLKYAAIVVVAFIVGRYTVPTKTAENDNTKLEVIYNQVSEDDIVEFIIDDNLISEI